MLLEQLDWFRLIVLADLLCCVFRGRMTNKSILTPIAIALGLAITSAALLAQPAEEPAAAVVEPRVITVAEAERSDPFSALVGKRTKRARTRPTAVQVERYVIATDGRAFLFENRGEQARLKFLCRDNDERLDCKIDPERTAEEIHLLTPTTGPRGDLIFKDNEGSTFLRIASYGGATVFWPGEKAGHAASKSFGDETSLRLPFADIATAERRAQQATAELSALTGSPILIDLGDPAVDDSIGRCGAG